MKDHTGCKRGFTQLSKAWYADANLRGSDTIDEITMGFYHPEGGTTGEFSIKWKELAGKVPPRLEAFDDGWSALNKFRDVLDKMAEVDDDNITPNEMNKVLIDLGIEDMTPITREL